MNKRRVFFNRLLECWISQHEDGWTVRCGSWDEAMKFTLNWPWPGRTLTIRQPVRFTVRAGSF